MPSSPPSCLVADTDARHAARVAEFCAQAGFRVTVVDTAELSRSTPSPEPDLAFVDASMGLDTVTDLARGALADSELFAMAAEDDTVLAEACIRAGCSFFFRKPIDEAGLEAMVRDIAAEATAPEDADGAVPVAASMVQFGLLRGSSRGMRKLFRLLRKIAPTEASVLVVGESGTGKELVAETLHHVSSRADKPYLTVNCAAIAENLIESELFGHEKGSFSGALRRHEGFFERAHGGTLFLDEITEMSPDLQAKLLRVLESGEIRRIGGGEVSAVDVRIIAATNRDPREAVAEGSLREDLFYRIAHVTAQLPPLRRRGGDIAGLAQHFLRQLNEEHGTSLRLSPDALAYIEGHSWPGNVRELRHSIERAYILSEDEIRPEALDLDETDAPPPTDGIAIPLGMDLAEAERRIILANLDHFDGDKKTTAERLGVSLKTLYNRLNAYREDR